MPLAAFDELEGPEHPGKTLSQLSAVHVVYSVDRTATEYDILISTAVECLAPGTLTTSELHGAVRGVWPGADVKLDNLQAALTAGEQAGLLMRSGDRWALATAGRAEIAKSREWAETTMRLTSGQLREKAAKGYGPIDDDEATLWIGIVAMSLFAGIAAASAAFRGDIQLLADQTLSPASFDHRQVRRLIDKACARPDVADFLEAMALAALDPSDPFGNQLVTSITTGYVLQAFLARRDSVRAREALGSLRGVATILDTPVLLPMLGPDEVSSPMSKAISAALAEGLDVIVPEHTIQELNALLHRAERNNAATINSALRAGASSALLRRLIDDPFVELFLLWRERQGFSEWSAFRTHVLAFPERLKKLGVKVVAHGNGSSDHVSELQDKLGSYLLERGRERGPEEIQRDANTMAMAWRVRRNKAPDGMWPSAWVVTTDVHMAQAYRKLNRGDKVSLTIAPSQWLSVLSIFGEVATVEELAKAAAVMLAQDTMLRVAARYPASATIEIATALAPAGESSETDVRLAQLSLDDLMEELTSKANGSHDFGLTIAAKILERRTARLEQTHQYEMARLAKERQHVQEEGRTTRELLERERGQRLAAERASDIERRSREALEAGMNDAQTRTRRRYLRNIGLAIGGAVTSILAVVGMVAIATDGNLTPVALSIATALSTLIFWDQSERWVNDVSEHWRRLAMALLPQLVGVVVFVWSFR